MQIDANDTHTVSHNVATSGITPLIGNIVSRHSSIGKRSDDGHLMAARGKRLAYVTGVEGLWPIVLAGDKDAHLPCPFARTQHAKRLQNYFHIKD